MAVAREVSMAAKSFAWAILIGVIVAAYATFDHTFLNGVTGTSSIAYAQAPDAASTRSGSTNAPRTSWGHPDLQGTWTNFDRTPFERPDPTRTPRRNTGAAGVGPAPEFSQDWAHSRLSPVRPSMVIEPKEGRVPVRAEAEARRDDDLAHLTDSPEYSSPWE